MKSVMQHTFSEVPKANIPRSSFDRSHGYKTTFDAGYLIPFFVDEALPGDTFNCKVTAFGRLATPIYPVMDNLFLDTQFFAVPMRLLWNNWERMNGAQDNPNDTVDYLTPTLTSPAGGYAENSVYDYMGIPPSIAGIQHSALPLRAYNLIWNEWYRDQNLQSSQTVQLDDGPDDPTNYFLVRRGKRHDYFTSCLPWPQKGDAVDLPLGTSAPVAVDGPQTGTGNDIIGIQYSDGVASMLASGTNVAAYNTAATNDYALYADLTEATGATINSLRQAFQIQKLLERDARGGTRYVEIIKSHFGVTSPDFRLQRPEYLGGGSTMVNISPIAQTSSTDGTSPQGNLSAMGTASFNNHGFVKSFTEHCIIMGFVSIRADLTYQQGLNRMWSRSTRYDYYWPALSHIGEQAVLNKEIFVQGTSDDDDVFGYQERYGEYRYKPSLITGRFRSDSSATLDSWHLSQDFSSLPVLNPSFIEDNPPIDRVIAVGTEPHMIFDSYIKMRCARPMPLFGVPGMMDRF